MKYMEWAPRLLGIAIAVFYSLFALGPMTHGEGGSEIVGRLMSLLPSLIVAAAVVVAWRRPAVGALAFLVLATLYTVTTKRLDWALVIAGPLLVTGILHVINWVATRRVAVQ